MNKIGNIPLHTFRGTETITKKTTIEDDLKYLAALKSSIQIEDFKRSKIWSENGDFIETKLSNASGDKFHLTKDRDNDFISISKTSPDRETTVNRNILVDEPKEKALQDKVLAAIKSFWQAIKGIKEE